MVFITPVRKVFVISTSGFMTGLIILTTDGVAILSLFIRFESISKLLTTAVLLFNPTLIGATSIKIGCAKPLAGIVGLLQVTV